MEKKGIVSVIPVLIISQLLINSIFENGFFFKSYNVEHDDFIFQIKIYRTPVID